MSPSEPVVLRPSVVRVPRRRFADSMISIVAAMLLVGAGGVAGALLQRAEMRAARSQAELAVAYSLASKERDELRALALDGCRARQEIRLRQLRADCDSGRLRNGECAEGQYRMDPCRRYAPPEPAGQCLYPGTC